MIVYKTTNLINNKIYIGKDTHDNPKYLGSGIVLKRAIKKYGKLNFLKETIEIKEFGCVTLAAKYLNIARTTAGQYAKCEKEITPGIIIKYK